MDTFHQRCCGLDVHKKTVMACVMTPEGRETRTFRTMTGELLALADWLKERGVVHVAMESTGVYWKPVYNLLEDEFKLMVVNAAHMRAVPGRKTDVKDAEWIAELLQHGLLRASFIPERPQRELRELTRYRRSLVEERSREANRIQKLLEGANIKLSSVATDVLGASGRAMIEALASGEEDPQALAGLAKGRLRHGGGDRSGDRHGHGAVSHAGAPGVVGGSVSRKQAERREAKAQPRTPWEQLAEASPGGGGQSRRTDQDLPWSPISPVGASHRGQASRHGRGPLHRRHTAPRDQDPSGLCGYGATVLPRAGPCLHHPQDRPSIGTPRP